MSSVKEYWNRASIGACSDFDSTASDYTNEDSSLSSIKEYRDGSCNVDFDGEINDLIDTDYSDGTNNAENTFNKLPTKFEKNIDCKSSSKYVRWNVLMILGVGLWAVLCIVDIYSGEITTKDWLAKFVWQKTTVSENVIPKKADISADFYLNFRFYFWKVLTIGTSSGAYMLLFLILIAFCNDSRLRRTRLDSAVKNAVVPKCMTPTSHGIETKCLPLGVNVTKIPKINSISLELRAPLLLMPRKMAFTTGRKNTKLIHSRLDYFVTCSRDEMRMVRIFENSGNRGNEPATCFTIYQEIVTMIDMKNRKNMRFLLGSNEVESRSKAKTDIDMEHCAQLCLIRKRSAVFDSNSNTFDLEIAEYLGRARPSPTNVPHNHMFDETEAILEHFQRKVKCDRRTGRNRIITSSPAFKKFLSNLQSHSNVS